MPGPVSSGLFVYVKDVERIARFYESVLGLSRLHGSDELLVLQGQHLQLVVHAIPAHIASTIRISSPPQRREDTALKFFFTVPGIDAARTTAAAAGGEVFAERWHGPGFIACNACDPEGNIFQLREAAA